MTGLDYLLLFAAVFSVVIVLQAIGRTVVLTWIAPFAEFKSSLITNAFFAALGAVAGTAVVQILWRS